MAVEKPSGKKQEKPVRMRPEQFKQAVFLILVLLIIALAFASLAYAEIISRNIFWIALLVIFLVFLWQADFLLLLKEYERAVIFRFGKVKRVGGPGWALFIPAIEDYSLVDLRVHTIDIPPQKVVTNDNIELSIDAVLYIKVKGDRDSVINSVVKVEDYEKAARLYVTARIRDITGSMVLQQVIASVEVMNRELKEGLKAISEGWGVECEAVEITDVKIPKTVLEAMHMQKAAEQEKLARIERAEAHKTEIDAVRAAAEQLSDKALSYYYIRALEKMSEGKATKIIFPAELSRFAELLAGKITAAKPAAGSAEQMIEKYAPLMARYLKEERRERTKSKEKKR